MNRNLDVPTDELSIRKGFADGLLTDCDLCGLTMRNGGSCCCEDDFIEPGCAGCSVSLADLDHHYIAQCGAFCESCMELHLGTCGACLAEFAGEFSTDVEPYALQLVEVPAGRAESSQLSLF